MYLRQLFTIQPLRSTRSSSTIEPPRSSTKNFANAILTHPLPSALIVVLTLNTSHLSRLPVCLPACLSGCVFACVSACLPACLPDSVNPDLRFVLNRQILATSLLCVCVVE